MSLSGNLLGAHIRLRAPEPEDLAIMFRLENEEDEAASTVATGPYSRYQLRKYILEAENDLFTDRQLRLMVEHRAARKVVGIVDLFDFSPRFRRAELGILINKEYRGKGLAKETLHLIEQHCHKLGLHQLYVYVRADNIAARSLFAATGYRQAGVLCDWLLEDGAYWDVWLLQKILS